MPQITAPDPIQAAWACLATDRQAYEGALETALAPQEPYLTSLERQMYARGKRLRPLLLLLSYHLAHGETSPLLSPASPKAIKAAVALEMLHVATLIHDDIVDAADSRRDARTIQAARGVETAVLIGDLQFIQAIRIFADSVDTASDMGIVRLVLDVGFKICCGELDELAGPPGLSTKQRRQHYRRTIERKTAVLFGLACEVGATLGGAGTRVAMLLGQYGRHLGYAFQIMDDLLDLVSSAEVSGKPVLSDLGQRIWTLPIINAVEELGPDHPVSRFMAGGRREAFDPRQGVRDVIRTDGFVRAYGEARREILQALAHLEPFVESLPRGRLGSIARHVMDRGWRVSVPATAA
jgi:heptaprenyl diphosphate synthase